MPVPDGPTRPPADAPRRLRRLAWLLDSAIRLPGGFSIGIDGILGLIPGAGDLLAAVLSSYIVVEAARMRLPGSVLLRMVWNIALELIVGAIPLLGDLFDIVFKANVRNVKLIEDHLADPRATRSKSRRGVFVVLLGLSLLLLLLALALLVGVLRLVWAAFGG